MILNLFKHPKKKYVYAVTGGAFLGEMLVFMEKTNEVYSFLSLPDMKIRDIPADKFNFGLTEKILDTVEKLPSSVYKVCQLQYKKNRSLNLETEIK